MATTGIISGEHVLVGNDAICETAPPSITYIRRALVKHLDLAAIGCARCRQLSTAPKPLGNPLGAQIQADMRRRYGPSIEDPEWATEGFVPR